MVPRRIQVEQGRASGSTSHPRMDVRCLRDLHIPGGRQSLRGVQVLQTPGGMASGLWAPFPQAGPTCGISDGDCGSAEKIAGMATSSAAGASCNSSSAEPPSSRASSTSCEEVSQQAQAARACTAKSRCHRIFAAAAAAAAAASWAGHASSCAAAHRGRDASDPPDPTSPADPCNGPTRPAPIKSGTMPQAGGCFIRCGHGPVAASGQHPFSLSTRATEEPIQQAWQQGQKQSQAGVTQSAAELEAASSQAAQKQIPLQQLEPSLPTC